jgi:succinoglycan biosynthesis transport protein ExoP
MDQQLDEPDLRSYLGILARRKWWVIGITVIFVGVAVAMSMLAEPQYRVKARVLTASGPDLGTLVLSEGRTAVDLDREAQNNVARIDGTAVRYAVTQALPTSLSADDVWRVNARDVEQNDEKRTSSVIELSLVSTDPDAAVQVLRVYAATYVEEQDATHQAELASTMVALNNRLSEVNQELDEATARVGSSDPVQRDAALATVNRLRAQSNDYQDAIDRLEFGQELAAGGAEVVSPPLRPQAPISPNIPKNIAIGLVFGLFLGVAIAFLRDYFDDSVKSKEVVEQVTGVPALGLIPKFATNETELVVAAAPSAPAAEAFRTLRTSVKFLSVDREVRVVQVSSPSPGEGKTVTAVNLAAVFAQAGDRVVLVGADLRRPRAEEILGVPLIPGLTGVLIGEIALPQAIRAVDGVPNLSVLPAGSPPPNPSELLSGERARRLVDVLAQTYDLVVLDCPPVLPVTDALVLARTADTTLLVTSVNHTSRRALDRCVEVLQQVDAPLMGTVMTSLTGGATFGSDTYRYETTVKGKRKYAASSYGGNGYGPATGQYAADPARYEYDTGTMTATTSSQPDREMWSSEPPLHRD